MSDERAAIYAMVQERERRNRWNAPGRARVTHPRHGSVIVPHSSNFAAIQNAAEYWKCDWPEITDAEVQRVESGAGPVVRPKEFCTKRVTASE